MKHQFPHFARGYIGDGDPADLPLDSLSNVVNLDLDVGVGLARLRAGLDTYTDLGTLPDLSNAAGPPNGGTWFWYDVIQWDSGITTVQHNTLLVYRELNNSNPRTWEDAFLIYSNAPEGGNGNDFTLLKNLTTDYFAVPFCGLDAINGQVRVRMGPGTDGMIHANLCEEGDRTLPTMTITSGTTASPQLPFGAGGHVYKGWLWDYWKLYWSDVDSSDVYAMGQTGQIAIAYASATENPLEECAYVGAICPVYDDVDEQYGVPLVFYVQKGHISKNQRIKITFNIAAGSGDYNKRIAKFAIYGQKKDRTNRVDDTNVYRLKTVAFSSLTSSVDVYIDESHFSAVEGTWAADSKGRPLTLHAGDKSGSSLSSPARLDPKGEYVDDEITVKCAGVMLRRKRAFAWGINHDPGQTRIAISMPDTNTSGQIDVFYKINRIWRDGSRATTYLMMFYDRMFLWNAHNSYWIDLEQRLDDQSMELDSGFGIGTSIVRTIAKGTTGLFWANHNSVYRFSTGAPMDLTLNAWREEWLAISDARKDNAVAGYCNYRAEYWLAVQTGDDEFSVYVWSDVKDNWRIYRFGWDETQDTTEIIPMGFFNDALGRWVLYGRLRTGGASFVARFDGTSHLDLMQSVPFELQPQWIGERDGEMVLDRLDLQRATDANSENVTVTVYLNEITTAASDTVIFPPTRRQAVRLRRGQRCNNYRLRVRGTLTNEVAVRPAIKQMTVETVDDIKRSR